MVQRITSVKFLVSAGIVVLALYFGRTLFVPLFFALFVSFIIYPLTKWFENKGWSRSLAIGAGLFIGMIPVGAIMTLFLLQLNEIISSWHLLSEKITSTSGFIRLPDIGGMSGTQRGEWVSNILSSHSSGIFSGIIFSLSALVQLVVIPVYAALILYHRNRLVNFFSLFFPSESPARIRMILHDTVTAYYNFVRGMLVVYLVVGTLNSAGLFLLGIPHALVFGFTASILTFIPYIGIIIGSVMPVITAWTLHDSIYYPLGVVAVFTFIQVLEANIIFPLAVSYRIKVNALTTLVSIFLGAIIWGTAGMILFIPFVALLKLVAEKTKTLQPLAELLGD